MYYGRITPRQSSNWSSSLYLQFAIHKRWLEASDKSVDLPVKRIQFRDETSDRDGLSIMNTDFDYTRASFNSSKLQNYYKFLLYSSLKPVQRFNFFSLSPTVFWLAGDVVTQQQVQ